MIQKKLFDLLLFLCMWMCLFGTGKAQVLKSDTTSNRVFSVRLDNLEWGFDSLIARDTLLRNFHLSHTPLIDQPAFQNQGMWGTAQRTLELGDFFSTEFNEGFRSLDGIRKSAPDEIAISGKPVSDLHYVQGYPQMIYITAKHTQNLGPYASFGIDYRRLKMQNIYFNNLPLLDRNRIPNIYNTGFHFRFDPPNNRYLLLLQVMNNRITNQETGGITEEGIFDSLGAGSRLFNQAAPLPDAVNVFKDLGVNIHQYYIFRRSDSTTGSQMRVFHHLSLANNRNEFNSTGADSGFFRHQYLGDISADRQQFKYLTNELGLGRNDGSFFSKVSIKQQTIGFWGTQKENAVYTNLYVKASGIVLAQKKRSGINGSICLSGYNRGDLFLSLFYHRKLNQNWQLNTNFSAVAVESDFQQNYYYGNHFRWSNDFNKQSNISGDVQLILNHKHPIQIGLHGGSIKNFIYYGNNGYPVQHRESELWYKMKFHQALNFRYWGIRNLLIFQQVNADVLPMPKVVAKSTWLFKSWLFHENMYFESGIDLFYHSGYVAPEYNPATRQFLNGQLKSYGNYPLADVFIDARIKTVSLMFRMHHVNQDIWNNESVILSPGYPILPRSFSFGIRWVLTN